MSDLFGNKILAAGLATGLALIGVNAAGNSIFKTEAPEEPGYFVEVKAVETGTDEGLKWVPPTDYGVLLASADATAGERKAAACVTCHSFEQGGAAKQGPNLYNIVMKDVASTAGFSYSSVLSNMEGAWDYAALDGFLKDPKGYARGTAMNYVGLGKERDRINVIAYLRSLSASPAALPAPLPPEAFIEPVAEGEGDAAEVVDASVETVALEDGAAVESPDTTAVTEAVAEAEAAVETVVEDVVEAVEDVAVPEVALPVAD